MFAVLGRRYSVGEVGTRKCPLTAPGSNQRKVILKRVPRSIHVPSEAHGDDDLFEDSVSVLEVDW